MSGHTNKRRLTNFTAADFSALAGPASGTELATPADRPSEMRVAAAGAALPAEPTVKTSTVKGAQDFTALGYLPSPETAWAPGQAVTVGTHNFHWDGYSWRPGASPAAAVPEPVVED